ncbi:nitroreductase family protein [archaeon]|nr:nitroreductase family protein [archaeon]
MVNKKESSRGKVNNDMMLSILDYARLAPSSHNTQPWKFSISESKIQILPDLKKALSIADPVHRELFISLGCAISNLEIAANHYGYAINIDHPKQKTDPIRIILEKLKKDAQDFPQLKRRYTDRGKYSQKPLPKDLLKNCRELCKEGIHLELLVDEDKEYIARMVYEGDIIQFNNPQYRKELAYWLRKGVLDGGKISNAVGAFVVSTFNLGKTIGKKELSLILSSPVYAVLGSENDNLVDWINIGISYERIALYLSSIGISNHPMNQGLLELSDHRKRITETCENISYAQFGFRIGYNEKTQRKSSPRFKLNELLVS